MRWVGCVTGVRLRRVDGLIRSCRWVGRLWMRTVRDWLRWILGCCRLRRQVRRRLKRRVRGWFGWVLDRRRVGRMGRNVGSRLMRRVAGWFGWVLGCRRVGRVGRNVGRRLVRDVRLVRVSLRCLAGRPNVLRRNLCVVRRNLEWLDLPRGSPVRGWRLLRCGLAVLRIERLRCGMGRGLWHGASGLAGGRRGHGRRGWRVRMRFVRWSLRAERSNGQGRLGRCCLGRRHVSLLQTAKVSKGSQPRADRRSVGSRGLRARTRPVGTHTRRL